MSASLDSERRETPLAAKLKARIRRDGPISVADYMQACLADPELGYYTSRPAIGAAGDFVTAPEISQTFGELIGLWSAVVWQQMGRPRALDLVELGPGRGTLMRDALRATRIVPGFADALRIHLVESNGVLAAVQRELVTPQAPTARWHSSLEAFVASAGSDDVPLILLGNEFLDTCPASQSVVQSGRLTMRGVGLDDKGELQFTLLDGAGFPPAGIALRDDDILESQDFHLATAIARLVETRPQLAALFIDYGHLETQAGETLQAVREHKAEPPLTSPGEADLTVQVDFAAFRSAMEHAWRGGDASKLGFNGPITQAEFLGRLGIMERASRLMAANPSKALAIETGVARLMAPGGMGSRFKVIGFGSSALLPLPGFA